MNKYLKYYDLKEIVEVHEFKSGTVQKNYFVETLIGKYVLRISNRSYNSLLFEVKLLEFLTNKNYPCPRIVANKSDELISRTESEVFVLFEYIEGEHHEVLSDDQEISLIENVAKLNVLTEPLDLEVSHERYHYSVNLVKQLADDAYAKYGLDRKYKWLIKELKSITIPNTQKLSICHCDFNASNILFENKTFKALIDFDDACMTYSAWDLIGLMDPFKDFRWDNYLEVPPVMDLKPCKKIIEHYEAIRSLNTNEKYYLYDVYKLTILLDVIWYYSRGEHDFYEQYKIDALNKMGKELFYHELFEF